MMAILQDMKTHENLHIIIIKGTIFDALKLWIVIKKDQRQNIYTDRESAAAESYWLGSGCILRSLSNTLQYY